MSNIKQVKVGGAVVPGAYSKSNTEGDAYRFVAAEQGYTQIIHRLDNTQRPDGVARVTFGPNWPAPVNRPQYADFALDFRYLVGSNQLEVHICTNKSFGWLNRIMKKSEIERARQAFPGWTPADLDPAGNILISFDEIASDKVRIFNPPVNYVAYLFSVPHTSLQAATRDRLLIRDQGDNIGIELLGPGNGILLKSEDGKRGVLRLDNELGLGVDPA